MFGKFYVNLMAEKTKYNCLTCFTFLKYGSSTEMVCGEQTGFSNCAARAH